MSEETFPSKVTKDNIPQLVKRAERIRKDLERGRYGIILFILVILPYIFIGLGTFFLMFWLAVNHYLDFLLIFSTDITIILFFAIWFVLLLLASVPPVLALNAIAMRLMRRFLGFPKIEEAIFADCFIIANHLMKNERVEAVKETKHFLLMIREFTKRTLNPVHPKRSVYTPEFNLIRSGKTEISRMLMFSKDNLSELFMKFGLSFVQNDDPEAFSTLQQIVCRIGKFGEPKGRFQRFLSGIERYPHASPFLLTMIIVIVAILYYCLSGQQLPI